MPPQMQLQLYYQFTTFFKNMGFGLKLFDAYKPYAVTGMGNST
jgi:hypothetical protein